MIGNRESLTPAFDARSITTPIGWYPRPSRLLQPVEFGQKESADEEITSESNSNATVIETRSIEQTSKNLSDPREKLANRLKSTYQDKPKFQLMKLSEDHYENRKRLLMLQTGFV